MLLRLVGQCLTEERLQRLASTAPDLVKTLAAEWDAWAKRADVLPLGAWNAYQGPNRAYKESAGRKPAPSTKEN